MHKVYLSGFYKRASLAVMARHGLSSGVLHLDYCIYIELIEVLLLNIKSCYFTYLVKL